MARIAREVIEEQVQAASKHSLLAAKYQRSDKLHLPCEELEKGEEGEPVECTPYEG